MHVVDNKCMLLSHVCDFLFIFRFLFKGDELITRDYYVFLYDVPNGLRYRICMPIVWWGIKLIKEGSLHAR